MLTTIMHHVGMRRSNAMLICSNRCCSALVSCAASVNASRIFFICAGGTTATAASLAMVLEGHRGALGAAVLKVVDRVKGLLAGVRNVVEAAALWQHKCHEEIGVWNACLFTANMMKQPAFVHPHSRYSTTQSHSATQSAAQSATQSATQSAAYRGGVETTADSWDPVGGGRCKGLGPGALCTSLIARRARSPTSALSCAAWSSRDGSCTSRARRSAADMRAGASMRSSASRTRRAVRLRCRSVARCRRACKRSAAAVHAEALAASCCSVACV